ncbi:tryptophan synthase subunit alpha [Sphingomonas sp.]|uniref:tryptophan synthase subunit alpha n=1 Tax=Sphingomonas sp. TaxID=28214 RepID=UPI0017AF2F0B|nr:tryptophan synthase subunit alpha [Sphingomonas sp.]MBA3511457.1 tryptophan synthase subunit alpha [Sphingomonas sp.]
MFERLSQRGEGAFGAFLMLGDPDLETSAGLLDALVEGGADMVEVGIPFSDPIADGPVIQAAARRALDAGVRVDDCFELIAGLRERHPDIPIGILTYANLVVARGRLDFMKAAASAGTDSLLVADVPAREAQPWTCDLQEAGIEPVLIAAANTPAETLQAITRLTKAFTYCVSRTGVTGVHADARFESALPARISDAGGPPPIFGFGISRPEHVRATLAAGAAGAISGTAVVRLTLETEPCKRVVEFVSAMKAATL